MNDNTPAVLAAWEMIDEARSKLIDIMDSNRPLYGGGQPLKVWLKQQMEEVDDMLMQAQIILDHDGKILESKNEG